MTTSLMPVVLWSQPTCGPCVAAGSALKARSVPYIKLDVKYADSARVALWRRDGLSTPIIETDGAYFSGVDIDRLDALAVERGVLVSS